MGQTCLIRVLVWVGLEIGHDILEYTCNTSAESNQTQVDRKHA